MFEIGDEVLLIGDKAINNNSKLKQYVGSVWKILVKEKFYDSMYYVLDCDTMTSFNEKVLAPVTDLSLSAKDIDEVMYEI